jgi:hypothetical protein
MTAIALWGGGCYLLHLACSLTQARPPPPDDAASTAVYLITFFYIFAFWQIENLVERLFDDR